MSPYTKLAVRSLGPASGLTLEQHRDVPAVVRVPPAGGTRRHGTDEPVVDWRDRALCAGKGSEYGSVWLYPSQHSRSVVDSAVRLCRSCPVRDECGQQPRPHVGITAGFVHWDGAPVSRIRLCQVCLEPLQTPKRFCSESCRNRWYYEAKRLKVKPPPPVFLGRPVGPLMDWFGSKPVTTIAQLCGVTVRTVYRWQTSGVVPGGAVDQVTRRLEVTIGDVWGEA